MKGVRSNIFYSGLEDDSPINNSSGRFLFWFLHIKITSNPFVKKKKKKFPVRERLHKRLQVLPAAVCRRVLLIAGHDCSGTSPLGSPYSWDTSIQGTQNLVPEKNFHIIFECVTAIEGTPLFRGKGHIFWVPKPGLTSIQGTLSTQNMTYHKEGWYIDIYSQEAPSIRKIRLALMTSATLKLPAF